jgi:DNA repair exonuclease SbcCD ATPase subunit
MKEINQRLVEVKTKIKERERISSVLERLRAQKIELREKKNELYHQFEKEELDVKKLESISIESFLHLILGDKKEKLNQEKQEVIAVKFKYDTVCKEYENITEEIESLERKLLEYRDLDYEYYSLLKEKEKMIKKLGYKESDELNELIEMEASLSKRIKELEEAISAGNELYYSLSDIKDSLQSASNWGTWDTLGGGLISTVAKHSRIDEAKNKMDRVQILINRFQSELNDVGEVVDSINIEIGSFLKFADYFFDGLFADLAVQSKINKAKEDIEETIFKVDSIISKLESELKKFTREYKEVKSERLNIIEKA